MLNYIKWGSASLILAVFSFISWVYIATYHPNAVEDEKIYSTSAAPSLVSGQHIKVLNWNVQFLASNTNNQFFFDGGQDPWPSEQTLIKTAHSIAEIIKQEDPDIIFLQELDDSAKRTYYHDQLQLLLDLLPDDYVSHTSTFYWLADFVPHPEIWGSVGMKMSIISKYKLVDAKRFALPAISSDDFITEQFNVKRAVLGTYIPIEGGKRLRLLNTHLSAFAQGTDTMFRQVAVVKNLLEQFEDNGESVLLAGDFNLIPSQFSYERLSEKNRQYYNPKGSEIEPLISQYKSVPSLAETQNKNYQQWFTHSSNHSDSVIADKTIDYIFFTGDLAPGEHYVRSNGTSVLSDHLPVIASFQLSGGE